MNPKLLEYTPSGHADITVFYEWDSGPDGTIAPVANIHHIAHNGIMASAEYDSAYKWDSRALELNYLFDADLKSWHDYKGDIEQQWRREQEECHE